ncbi:uncharacterized protein ColSpa_01238 [Colletotrichum spaethianum]|uniref:DUF7730 domain-containing protein n=1 Tax=Colletotrichum spaethianum TaxID=700344 RepID=A0AA37L377_9PEZI|nr:uncharacterized protein ColSpa_01238 [Colletotrichum spaethianum]GKT41057.1 hypothetical protein ColSpa_01238 [Colletotrichum spaethianum]
MLNLTITIRPEFPLPPRPQRRGIPIMQFPREIRNQIYRDALVEPKRSEITHEPGCQFKSDKSTKWEPPAFLLKNVTVCENPHRLVTKSACTCDKRKCINLLQANRQIHAEAAPIFWSQKTFCFLSGFEVIVALKHILRHQYRNCVTEICLMSPADNGAPLHVSLDGSSLGDSCPKNWPLFWHTISKCFSLRRLQISPRIVMTSRFEVLHVTVKRPKLEIELVSLIPFFQRGQSMEEYPFEIDSGMHHRTIYGEVRYGVHSIEQLMQEDEEQEPDERYWGCLAEDCDIYNLYIFADVRERLLDSWCCGRYASPNATGDEDDEYWPFYFDIWHAMHQERNKFMAALDDGNEFVVLFYGLPPSGRQARQAAKQKYALENKQREMNGMTDAEREVNKKSRQLRKEKRKKLEEERQAIADENPRLPDPNINWVSPEILEKQQKEVALKEIRRSQKENSEMRRKERKRVQR